MTTDILLDDYTAWLHTRRYKESTIYTYLRPIKIAAERGLQFAEVSALGPEGLYNLVTGHRTASRHTPRAMYQSVLIYREFLMRTGRLDYD